jgi:hypothetical protein
MVKRILQRQIILQHKVGDNRGTAATHARVAVDEHCATRLNRLFHELVAGGPVLFQVGGWDIVLIDKFVDVIFGEFRLQL